MANCIDSRCETNERIKANDQRAERVRVECVTESADGLLANDSHCERNAQRTEQNRHDEIHQFQHTARLHHCANNRSRERRH